MQLQKTNLSFDKVTFFSPLFLDYTRTTKNKNLREFYCYEPDAEGIRQFLEEQAYAQLNRVLLVDELRNQNHTLTLSESSNQNISRLLNKNTYTVTTGHQLCLASGPAYFIYKIISVINVCEQLNSLHPDHHFVPVYWMASEDHDVEEINHLHLFGKKISWQTEQKGKVGSFDLQGMDVFLHELDQLMGTGEGAQHMTALLKTAYAKKNLAEATRYLVNELFGMYGLVVLDGDSKALKQSFIPEFKKDLFEQIAFTKVQACSEELKKQGYSTQVSPREINVFYTDKNLRERIVKDEQAISEKRYRVLNTDLSFSKESLEKQIESEPEKFSPNVVLRPLYQQKILPNVAYVGGPGELAYWLQYKTLFEEAAIPYPVLIPRNFIFYLEKSLQHKLNKLSLRASDFFADKEQLIKKYALEQHPFSLEKEKDALKKVFLEIRSALGLLDKTLEASSDAEWQKNLKGIEALEQKGIRAIKQKNEQAITQIETIYNRLFPQDIPQERVENFIRFYLNNPDFIADIKNQTRSFLEEKSVLILHEV